MVTERGVGGKRAGSKERMSSPGKSWILQEAEGKLWKPTTLAHFLVDHEVPFERVRQLRPASHGLVTRVLGVQPRLSCWMAIHPPSLDVRDLLLPNLLNMPFSDFGLGLDPELRSIIMHTTAQSFGCPACSGHGLCFGTVLKGSELYMEKTRKAFDYELHSDDLSPREIAAAAFSRALGQVPTKVTLDDRLRLARVFSRAHEETVILMSSVMALMIRFTDTFGVPLELKTLLLAEQYLQPDDEEVDGLRWNPGKYISPWDSDRLERELAQALEAGDLERKKEGIRERLKVFGMLARSGLGDEKAKTGIPLMKGRLSVVMKRELGFCPYYLERIRFLFPRRAIAATLVHYLNVESSPQLPVELKYATCYLMANKLNSEILRAHFGYLAIASGMPTRDLCLVGSGRYDVDLFSKTERFAFRIGEISCSSPAVLPPSLAKQLADHFRPDALVELITVTAIFNVLYWLVSAIPPSRYEPEIAAFADSVHGKLLRLRPGGETWPNWEEACDQVRPIRRVRVTSDEESTGSFV
eukprot:CAMPEP_0184680154 /NCGR_PEP_ID=MMETSP0312-20130426/3041_1 /TAXON_ID=31354 /ORGANISM="Compsopogon coeruleus, Strain SAG 36.94" /LENGTH=526 /DNA_ID=CAMNT_0027130089 /DNA_START=83 /DNA_END=1663 /DNA_ORIENTATION=+